MVKTTLKVAFIILSCMVILACNPAKQVDLEVQIKVTLDGKPASQARIMFDGNDVGTTDADGRFNQRIKKQPGEEVKVSVHKDAEGYRIKPWENTFVTKLSKSGAVETYDFAVELEATRFFTVVVLDDEDGELLDDVTIKIGGKPAGTTDAGGEYLHEYTRMPKKGLKLQVAKKGYGAWKKSVRAKPGQRFEIALFKKRKRTVTKARLHRLRNPKRRRPPLLRGRRPVQKLPGQRYKRRRFPLPPLLNPTVSPEALPVSLSASTARRLVKPIPRVSIPIYIRANPRPK